VRRQGLQPIGQRQLFDRPLLRLLGGDVDHRIPSFMSPLGYVDSDRAHVF
jgi:hypothetical protein